ncbi:ATP-binding cassette domain-containing protein [Nocardioides dongxiaopingii]|uniref:ABC transporter ATP-binding protein n=1 Tax=Nocardioides TaxID=1839 RepID=UPI0010C7702B|nr:MULTISPECIES: ATP-binding cassette domain-containing protein [Nocardioides]QCW51196.1 ATP-binding cassette domain-containing protein [Nocardioides sp. S-1144]
MPTSDLDESWSPDHTGRGTAADPGRAAAAGVEVRCEGVVHLYRTFAGHDVVALRGIDLRIGAGERVAFLGPSGCGKSTLLTLLGGIQRPSAGRIFLDDEEISRLGERRLTRVRSRLVSTVLQGATRNLLPYATARQNLAFARLGTGARDDRRDLPRPEELLDVVGLADQRDQTVRTMSGGQRQRLALACAVATGPRLLLADEPTSALGHDDRDAVVALLHRIGADLGTTVVVVTHEAEVAATFPRTVTMKGGRIGAEGHAGSEYVVIGDEGLVHLPAELVDLWPAGTLVRIEQHADERSLVITREDRTGEVTP